MVLMLQKSVSWSPGPARQVPDPTSQTQRERGKSRWLRVLIFHVLLRDWFMLFLSLSLLFLFVSDVVLMFCLGSLVIIGLSFVYFL